MPLSPPLLLTNHSREIVDEYLTVHVPLLSMYVW